MRAAESVWMWAKVGRVTLLCEWDIHSSSVSVFMLTEEEGLKICSLLSHGSSGVWSLDFYTTCCCLPMPLSIYMHLNFNMRAFIDTVSSYTCVKSAHEKHKPTYSMSTSTLFACVHDKLYVRNSAARRWQMEGEVMIVIVDSSKLETFFLLLKMSLAWGKEHTHTHTHTHTTTLTYW